MEDPPTVSWFYESSPLWRYRGTALSWRFSWQTRLNSENQNECNQNSQSEEIKIITTGWLRFQRENTQTAWSAGNLQWPSRDYFYFWTDWLWKCCEVSGPKTQRSAAKLKWYVIISVDNSKVPCYTLPPTQHHSFGRNLYYPLFSK